jgi:nitroreductase
MTTTTNTSLTPTRFEVERAVSFGVRAPSIHNTQPWRWTYRCGVLELYADRSRQLPALDPDGRSLVLSCGAGLELARLGFAACGWRTEVDRLPDPDHPDLLARIHTVGRTAVRPATLKRAKAAERRHTERLPFLVEPVADDAIRCLLTAALDTGSYAYAVRRADEQLDLAVVFSWADGVEMSDPAYRAELAHWTRAADATDGVPAIAIPHVSAGAPRHTNVPVRDFEAGITGGQQLVDLVDERPLYIVLFSTADDRAARLRAGEAYARISVEAERLGLASSAMTQAVDLPAVRERFRMLMDWPDHPQMVLRVGQPRPGPVPPPTGRRPLTAVFQFEE